MGHPTLQLSCNFVGRHGSAQTGGIIKIRYVSAHKIMRGAVRRRMPRWHLGWERQGSHAPEADAGPLRAMEAHHHIMEDITMEDPTANVFFPAYRAAITQVGGYAHPRDRDESYIPAQRRDAFIAALGTVLGPAWRVARDTWPLEHYIVAVTPRRPAPIQFQTIPILKDGRQMLRFKFDKGTL